MDPERSSTPAPEPLPLGRSWQLLGWAEDATSALVRRPRAELATRVVLAFCLLEASPLDRRDVQVVAALLRRGCQLAGLDFVSIAGSGCAAAGQLGERCWRWLSHTSDQTPATHQEVGAGRRFRFERRPHGIDVAALEARFGRPGT